MSQSKPNRVPVQNLTTLEQLRAIESPVRAEIWDYVRAHGPCSAQQISSGLGRSPTSLYSHLELLLAAGLVVESGTLETGGREGALFDTASDEVMLRYQPDDPEAVASMLRFQGATLRQTQRELKRTILSGKAVTADNKRDTVLLSTRRRLSPSELEELNAHISKIAELMRQPAEESGGKMIAVTLAIHPTGPDLP